MELEARTSPGLLAAFENASPKTQQLVTASVAGVISALAVAAIILFFAKTVPQQETTGLSQLMEMGLAASVTAIAVGAIAYALGQMTTARINRSLDNLQERVNAVARGDLSVRATVYPTPELGQLATSFNQMVVAIARMLDEAQRQAEEQEKAKEDVQQQLIQLLRNLEENFSSNSTVEVNGTKNEAQEDELAIVGQRPLLEFIHYLHENDTFRGNFDLALFIGSSTLEEIQRHKDDLHYRKVWLEALLDETHREIEFIDSIERTGETN